MRAWTFGEAVASGQWGIREPVPEAPEVAPDILIVPLAAFDRAGHRIGYGAGYYDMTINALRAKKKVTAIGIAFAAQEIPPGSSDRARRAARSRANGARDHRFPRDLKAHAHPLYRRCRRPLRPHHRSERLPGLIADWKLDLVVVNGENAAGGFGITEVIYNEFIDAGADAITLGNHAWDQREALVFIERAPRLIRPLNYPKGTPGRGAALVDTKNGKRALVINAMGRIFMDPLDDPFAAIERELSACALKSGADAIVIDFHCEATSEKQAMGYFTDGRASLVVGTHTHAPTADDRILPNGTAFVSDVGMTGDYDSIIGMNKDEPLNRFLRKLPGAKFEASTGPATLCGLAVETDDATGLARKVGALRLGGILQETRPNFWD